jgi:hypothetical protein
MLHRPAKRTMGKIMRPPLDGVVLVTGASSGIGRELAILFAERAKSLVLVARRVERLEELKADLVKARPALEVHVERCDLARAGEERAMVERVLAKVGRVDVLVNNAGVGDMSVFDKADLQRTLDMIQLNVTSVTVLTRLLVAPMVERRSGGVLMVSSGFGLGFLPGFAAYIATKHFMTGLSEALCADLAGTGVVVTQVCPGPVATEFEQNIGNFTGKKVPSFIEISARRCARSAFRAFRRGRAMVVPGLIMRAVLWIARYSPRFLVRLFAVLLGPVVRKRQLRAAG